MGLLKCIDPGCRAQDRAPTLISELEASISRAAAYRLRLPYSCGPTTLRHHLIHRSSWK
jgi:hypothetical protein